MVFGLFGLKLAREERLLIHGRQKSEFLFGSRKRVLIRDPTSTSGFTEIEFAHAASRVDCRRSFLPSCLSSPVPLSLFLSLRFLISPSSFCAGPTLPHLSPSHSSLPAHAPPTPAPSLPGCLSLLVSLFPLALHLCVSGSVFISLSAFGSQSLVRLSFRLSLSDIVC